LKFDFTHPVIASGRLASTGETRAIVGMVNSRMEIDEVGVRDVEQAFKLHIENGLIFRHAGKLYHRSPLLDHIKTGKDFSFFNRVVSNPGHHVASITEDLGKELARLVAGGESRLLPEPRGGVIKCIRNNDTESAMSWASSLGSLERRNVRDIDEDAVLYWRDRVKAFWGNFLLVDGELFARCHEPLIRATPIGLFAGDYSFYRSHVDRPEIGVLGLPKGTGAWESDTQCFPADMFDEAQAYVEDWNWTTKSERRIEVFGECVALETLLDDELVRAAGHHVAVTIFALERMDDGRHKVELADAASGVIDAATRFREGARGIDELETTLAHLAEVGVRRRPQTDFDDRLRDLKASTDRVLARREALPISVSALRQGHTSPAAP
jgi:hypothetical protein